MATIRQRVGGNGGDHVDRGERGKQAHPNARTRHTRRSPTGKRGSDVPQHRPRDLLSIEEPQRCRVQEQHDRSHVHERGVIHRELQLPHQIKAPQEIEQPDEVHRK